MVATAPLRERHILLVDDEPSMTRVISRLLSAHGWKATIVGEPHRAVDLVRQMPGHFEVVITDMAMPGMTGDELASQLKALDPTLPIILSTGGGDGTLGLFAGILPKPFDVQTLVETIDRCLRPQ